MKRLLPMPHRKPVIRDINRTIGKRVQNFRKVRGLSQADIARQLDVTQGNMSSYERGDTRLNAEIIIKLSKILKVSADDLLGLNESGKKPPLQDRRFLRYLAAIDRLPQRDRDAILRILMNAVVARDRTGRSTNR